MGLGWVGSYGATGAAASLADILKQREIAQQRAFENDLKLRESARQDSESARQDSQLENQNLLATAHARSLYAPETFIGDSSPDLPRLQKYMQGTLRQVPGAPAMGPDFQGPSQNDLTPEEAQRGREGGWVTKPTGDQADKMADNSRLDRAASNKGNLSPAGEANITAKMAATWTKETAPTREIDAQVRTMHAGMAAARRGDLNAGAQDIIATFNKILDPGSVVRESEYNRSPSGLALEDRVKGWIEQLQKGGAGVPLVELERFARLAEETAATRYGDYLVGVRQRLERMADHYKIPPELVFDDIIGAGPDDPAAPAAAPAPGPIVAPAQAPAPGPGPMGSVPPMLAAPPEAAPVPAPVAGPVVGRAMPVPPPAAALPPPANNGKSPRRFTPMPIDVQPPGRTGGPEKGIYVTAPDGSRQGPFASQAAAAAFEKAAAALAKQHAGTGKP